MNGDENAMDGPGPVVIYTDGGCAPNPGPGGWGAVLKWGGHQREIFGGERDSTNNRMEITAAIEALEALKRPVKVTLYTDSVYLKKGITEWIASWRARGWRTAAKKPVKNEDLWRRLDTAAARHDVTWRWVKAHAGHADNELADQLATLGREHALRRG